jgi:hypothetical protein
MICLSLCTIGLDVELETNVIVEEGERKRPYVEPGHDAFDDNNVINAAGELGIQYGIVDVMKHDTNDKTNETNSNLNFPKPHNTQYFHLVFCSDVDDSILYFDNSSSNFRDNSRNKLNLFKFISGPKVGASQSSFGIYTAETFTIAVVVSCFASLIVGFLSGLMFSRRCKMGDSFASSSGGFSGAPYLEQRRLSRLNETNGSCNEPSKMNNFVDSLNSAVLKMANEKNNANANNTTSTLDLKPAVQKVKKTYV